MHKKSRISNRWLCHMNPQVKEWAKTHTIEDAKRIVLELEDLGEDVSELIEVVSELEEISSEVSEVEQSPLETAEVHS